MGSSNCKTRFKVPPFLIMNKGFTYNFVSLTLNMDALELFDYFAASLKASVRSLVYICKLVTSYAIIGISVISLNIII